MVDIFNTTPSPWTFTATPAPILYNSDLPLPTKPAGLVIPKSTQDADYWARVTNGMDFSVEDRFDFAAYNRILWDGLMGAQPYPTVPSGLDLRENRQELLTRHRLAQKQKLELTSKPGIN